MKNLKYTSIIIALMLSVGCDDILDTIPNDRISPEIFWKTEKDAILGANAVYTHLVETAPHYISWDGMTDIGFTNVPQSPESFILRGQFDPLNSRITNDWAANYRGIRTANAFLGNIDRVSTTNTVLIDRLKGEVRTLRAYFYIRLAFLWSDVPLVTSELTLAQSKSLTRTPVSQVWDFISTELTEAANLLPVTQTEKGRITKGAALGLKARAMLYAGRYQQAADAAQAVIDLNVHSLYSSYANLFNYSAENNPEILLDIQFIKGTFPNTIFSEIAQVSVNGFSRYVPTKNLVDAYEMTNGLSITDPGSGFDPFNPYVNRDPRLRFSVYTEGDILVNGQVFNPKPNSTTGDAVGSTFVVSPTGFNVKKYISATDQTTPTNSGINLILMRYAEVLLIYAEAKVELNTIDASVYDRINMIRQRADVNMPIITGGKTQAQLREIIRHERMVELAFEGQRFFDIRRWRIAEDVMPGKVFGMTYVNPDNELVTVEVLGWENFWSDENYLWPIPQSEREQNSNLTQNPGW